MTKYLVVDVSLTFRAIVANPQQPVAQQMLTQWKQEGTVLCAPSLWLYETVSALCKSVRFDQLTAAEAQRSLDLAQMMGIQLVVPNRALAQSAFEWTIRLQRSAAYDSFYLALATLHSGEFWTADQRLFNAVQQPWVHLLDAP